MLRPEISTVRLSRYRASVTVRCRRRRETAITDLLHRIFVPIIMYLSKKERHMIIGVFFRGYYSRWTMITMFGRQRMPCRILHSRGIKRDYATVCFVTSRMGNHAPGWCGPVLPAIDDGNLALSLLSMSRTWEVTWAKV